MPRSSREPCNHSSMTVWSSNVAMAASPSPECQVASDQLAAENSRTRWARRGHPPSRVHLPAAEFNGQAGDAAVVRHQETTPQMTSPARRRHQGEVKAIRTALRQGRQKVAVRLILRASRRRPATIESWQWVSKRVPLDRLIGAALRLLRSGHEELASVMLGGIDYREVPVELRRRTARALARWGRHELAIQVYQDLLSQQGVPKDYTDDMRAQDARRLGFADMHLAANTHLARLPAPSGAAINGFVVIYNVGMAPLTGLMIPLAGRLLQQGYPLVSVSAGTLNASRSGVAEFDRLQGCIAVYGESFVGQTSRGLAREWTVDWRGGVVKSGGINFFPYFQERLSQRARRYRADILQDPESAQRFAALQLQADVALRLCESLLPLAARGKPVRIALMDSHFAPQGLSGSGATTSVAGTAYMPWRSVLVTKTTSRTSPRWKRPPSPSRTSLPSRSSDSLSSVDSIECRHSWPRTPTSTRRLMRRCSPGSVRTGAS